MTNSLMTHGTDSLTDGPVSEVLAELFADADRERGGHRQGPKGRRGDPSRTRAGGPAETGDSRMQFARMRHAYMAVTPDVGRLLYQLARLRRATRVVEFGTSFGISTLHLGAAVLDNGGGIVIGTEYEQNKVEAMRASVARAGLADIVEVRDGDAAETLSHGLPETVDLLFLDGAKEMYGDVLRMVEPRLAPGSVVVADNASRATGFRESLDADTQWLSTFLEGEDLVIALRR